MLAFERAVVTSMLDDATPVQRDAVLHYVDGALRALPDYIRLGVVSETIAFTAWAGVRRVVSRRAETGDDLLDRLERNPIGLIRQYPRLIRSLVLFGQNEIEPEAA